MKILEMELKNDSTNPTGKTFSTKYYGKIIHITYQPHIGCKKCGELEIYSTWIKPAPNKNPLSGMVHFAIMPNNEILFDFYAIRENSVSKQIEVKETKDSKWKVIST